MPRHAQRHSWQAPLLWVALAAAAAACVLGYRITADASAPARSAAPVAQPNVAQKIDQALARDQSVERTADTISGLADTTQEQELAGQAQHFAGELLDLSFTIALDQAARAATTSPAAPANADQADDRRRLAASRAAVAADQALLDRLKDAGKTPASPEWQIAEAQLGLDQARLTDATNDAARANDGQNRLQQLLAEHTAAQTQARQATASQLSRLAAESQERDPASAHGLVGELRAAFLLSQKLRQLAAAQAEVASAQREVAATHDRMLAALQHDEAAQASVRSAALSAAATVNALQALAARQTQISRFDTQNDLDTELLDTYAGWLPLAQQQRRQALHLAAQSCLWLLGILAALLLLVETVERVFSRQSLDSRQAATLRHILRLGAQVLALILALIVAFGQPTQLLTILGLCGAGLTVAFQDAILSAAGWFVLIGRNGVHLGDWVEINGVSGEVVEVTLLKTVVIETGNWISVGHPTGRRVFFPNNYALKGAYFNFTTAGQWMWDEIHFQLPASLDTAAALASVTAAVERERAEAAAAAESEWRTLPRQSAALARPQVTARPAGGSAELVVRYPVRAAERAATRERLYAAITTALGKKPATPPVNAPLSQPA